MNKERRKKTQLAIDLLDEIITDEQEAYDNMPENLQQDSAMGDAVASGLEELQDAKDILEELIT